MVNDNQSASNMNEVSVADLIKSLYKNSKLIFIFFILIFLFSSALFSLINIIKVEKSYMLLELTTEVFKEIKDINKDFYISENKLISVENVKKALEVSELENDYDLINIHKYTFLTNSKKIREIKDSLNMNTKNLIKELAVEAKQLDELILTLNDINNKYFDLSLQLNKTKMNSRDATIYLNSLVEVMNQELKYIMHTNQTMLSEINKIDFRSKNFSVKAFDKLNVIFEQFEEIEKFKMFIQAYNLSAIENEINFLKNAIRESSIKNKNLHDYILFYHNNKLYETNYRIDALNISLNNISISQNNDSVGEDENQLEQSENNNFYNINSEFMMDLFDLGREIDLSDQRRSFIEDLNLEMLYRAKLNANLNFYNDSSVILREFSEEELASYFNSLIDKLNDISTEIMDIADNNDYFEMNGPIYLDVTGQKFDFITFIYLLILSFILALTFIFIKKSLS